MRLSSQYLVVFAGILAVGILALAFGSMENVTGAFSVDSIMSGSGFSSQPFTLNVNLLPSPNPEACYQIITSSEEDTVKETGENAVEAYSGNPAWTSIPGAKWIWKSYYVENPSRDETYTFVRKVTLTVPPKYAMIELAADNTYELRVNGLLVGASVLNTNYGSVRTYNLLGRMKAGENTIEIKVKNRAGFPDPTRNTAGLLYRINLTEESCGGYGIDIEGKPTFIVEDVKPGDTGEGLFSISVSGQEAWACLVVRNKQDLENGLIDPEEEAGDTTSGEDQGELSGFIELFGWIDTVKDGKYGLGDTKLFIGPISNKVTSFPIADPTNNMVLRSNVPKRVGLLWCFGHITVSGYSAECDGTSHQNNVAQTDSLIADLSFYAEQRLNNFNFKCSSLNEK
ncbi:MAG: hypothetical protein JW727_01225 [Candidatus Aenigmarchaeota archaeon]|nr:hypothetical protein [Candidatus Aenigmarchaeota archaeon]